VSKGGLLINFINLLGRLLAPISIFHLKKGSKSLYEKEKVFTLFLDFVSPLVAEWRK
jgi:hypothetical protein